MMSSIGAGRSRFNASPTIGVCVILWIGPERLCRMGYRAVTGAVIMTLAYPTLARRPRLRPPGIRRVSARTAMMLELPTAQLGQACRIFMTLAYPTRPESIPPKKRAYYAIDPARPLRELLPPAPDAVGIAQDL